MATKKDFTAKTKQLREDIKEATLPELPEQEAPARKPRKTYTAEEAAEAMMNGNTRGKKGLKMPRINVALPPDLKDYVMTLSRARGQSVTDFINDIIQEHMEKNREIYEKAKEFLNII